MILVNRSLARLFFGSEDPVGRMVHVDGRTDLPPQQIVGVVDDMQQGRLDQEPTPQFFVDYRQVLALTQARQMPVPQQERLAFGFLSFVVRTDGDPARLMPTMRSLIGRVDPNVGIDALLPMEQLVAASLTRQRFHAAVMGVFAAIAALLSAVGVYGVLAYAVGQRIREFGVRTALGATGRDILAMVLRQGLRLTSIGIGIGLAGATALTRYLEGMLSSVRRSLSGCAVLIAAAQSQTRRRERPLARPPAIQASGRHSPGDGEPGRQWTMPGRPLAFRRRQCWAPAESHDLQYPDLSFVFNAEMNDPAWRDASAPQPAAAPDAPGREHDQQIADVVTREQPRLRNFIRRRVADPVDAEDILQDVFYALIEANRLLMPIEHVTGWLYRVARNRITDLFRRKKWEELPQLDDLLSSVDQGPDARYARSVLIDALEAALAELPKEQRDVFLAHEIQGCTFKEMAAQTGVSVNTLLSRKRYAVLRLRNRLQEIHDDYMDSRS